MRGFAVFKSKSFGFLPKEPKESEEMRGFGFWQRVPIKNNRTKSFEFIPKDTEEKQRNKKGGTKQSLYQKKRAKRGLNLQGVVIG